MASVELTRRAEYDLRRLQLWLADKSPAAAERAAFAIVSALDRLGQFPELGSTLEESGIRELPVRFGRYGYVIRYGLNGERVIVTRIFHIRERR